MLSLGRLARTGFEDLERASIRVNALAAEVKIDPESLLTALDVSGDPDDALSSIEQLVQRSRNETAPLLRDQGACTRLAVVLGASRGFAEVLFRHPEMLKFFKSSPEGPPTPSLIAKEFTAAVKLPAGAELEVAAERIRVAYRKLLLHLAIWDLSSPNPVEVFDQVAEALADLSGAAIDAALSAARELISRAPGESISPGKYLADEIAATSLAVIAMGKSGAKELNYVSDVDVIFVGESCNEEIVSTQRALDIATRLAMTVMKIAGEPGIEPPLWEVDPNLRPEGKDGALVRTLDSHVQYYERWAKGWEFQALLKARCFAGDRDLGERYQKAIGPKVWLASAREGFVESVQAMRGRVTDNIPADEIDIQLKLGPGGLRDIEFTVQLLQLVHGATDPEIRQRGTIPALEALAANGYVGREEAAQFAADYRFLRVLEHRLQLKRLRRTHLMPREESELRCLARAAGGAVPGNTAAELIATWQDVRQRVRGLHERLFYRPLLSSVASLGTEGLELSSTQAEARLAAIGFRNPRGALGHIAALTTGLSRRATIQRHLMPVLISWFAEGADPDFGLLSFRRLSETLGETHWYLRILRDSTDAARRLTRVLSGSRFAAELLERTPEAVAWLTDTSELRPRSREILSNEVGAILQRHETAETVGPILKSIRRREVLRLALCTILDLVTIEELGQGLSDVTANHISALLSAIRGQEDDGIEFAVIAMGRFGGGELALGSDVDILYVYRVPEGLAGLAGSDHSASLDDDATHDADALHHKRALHIVAELVRLSEDARLPFELDPGLRPEGKNGVVVRSLDAYRSYYERWSLTWEAQALLRAKGIAGDQALIEDFTVLADAIRYPAKIQDAEVREIRRIKARVEKERLPQGADPTRHLKLGIGSLSDIEWFVQLIQLQHSATNPSLQTTSTMSALEAANNAGFVSSADYETLRAAWIFVSRTRTALTLWLDKTTDVLPTGRSDLDGVARLMNYPIGVVNQLEEDYLKITRHARTIFERGFYGK